MIKENEIKRDIDYSDIDYLNVIGENGELSYLDFETDDLI